MKIKGYENFRGKIKGYENLGGHLRGAKFSGEKIRGPKFFGAKIRGTKILVNLPKNAPTGYPGLKKTNPLLEIDEKLLHLFMKSLSTCPGCYSIN